MTIDYAVIPSPVGRVGLAWSGKTLLFAEMDHALHRSTEETDYAPGGTVAHLKEHVLRRFPDAELRRGDESAPAVRAVRRYFDGELKAIDQLDVDPGGTEFQAAVWRELRRIPAGRTSTYGELAERVGHPGSARAAGGAVGSNPIPIVIPCHRIVGSTGKLTGFGGGIARKRWLLRHEGVPIAGDAPGLFD
jgi:methylated-DNA-[protein]-cysteine S-methyltransferase